MRRGILVFLITMIIGSICYADAAQESNLFNAIVSGNILEVENLLKSGMDPNIRGANGWTPLLTACSGGKTDIALLLLKFGADPNLAGNQNETPLLYAVMTSNRILVKELLASGADPNIKMATGQSPLDMAKMLRLNDVVNMMVKPSYNDKQIVLADKTIFHLLNDDSIAKAKEEANKNSDFSYFIDSKVPNMFKLNSMPSMVFRLITPYSLLRYGFYREKQTFITFEANEIQEIYDAREYAFIYVFPVQMELTQVLDNYKNLVIRKNGIVYKSIPISLSVFNNYDIPDNRVWAFPIGLFDGEDLEIIAIDPWDDQQIIKITKKKLKGLQ